MGTAPCPPLVLLMLSKGVRVTYRLSDELLEVVGVHVFDAVMPHEAVVIEAPARTSTLLDSPEREGVAGLRGVDTGVLVGVLAGAARGARVGKARVRLGGDLW
jgi:hypothetical protein